MSVMNLGHCNNMVQTLSSIEVPDLFYDRHITGVQVLDEAFGGTTMPGLMPGASFLVTGFPGAGKSTLMLQMADMLQIKNNCKVLYNMGEQNKYMVSIAAKRLGLRGNFEISQFENVEDVISYCKMNKIDVLIQDSLQTLSCDELKGNNLILECGKRLAAFSSEFNVTTFIVGQITKAGDFAGPMQLKHTVDAHAHLSLNKSTGHRIFELKKNRIGPSMVCYEFFMTSNGLDFRQLEDVSVEESSKLSKTAERKESFIKLIKNLLLSGARLSGYSHEEHLEIIKWIKDNHCGSCSHMTWRKVLSDAINELEQEGYRFASEKLQRREYQFISDAQPLN